MKKDFLMHRYFHIVIVLFVFITVSAPQPVCAQTDPFMPAVMANVGREWIMVAKEQYNRDLFEQAEKSLLSASKYRKYLTETENDQLDSLFENVRISFLERKRVDVYVRKSDEFLEQGRLIDAQQQLEQIKESRVLTFPERQQILQKLSDIDLQLQQQQREIAVLYKQSVEYYRKGHSKRAREGFAKIDRILAQRRNLLETSRTEREKIETETGTYVSDLDDNDTVSDINDAPQDLIEFAADSDGLTKGIIEVASEQIDLDQSLAVIIAEPCEVEIEVHTESSDIIDQGREVKIRQGYTQAVVRDALMDAQSQITKKNFGNAEEIIDQALTVVENNREYLGSGLYDEYKSKLQKMADKLN